MSEVLVKKVQAFYAAFERGDLATIVAGLAPDVDWRINVAHDLAGTDHPLFRAYTHATDVPQFFEALVGALEPRGMDSRGLAVTLDGQSVLALFRESYVVRRTGQPLTIDTIHQWTFDPAGRVVAWRGYTDTAQELRAVVG